MNQPFLNKPFLSIIGLLVLGFLGFTFAFLKTGSNQNFTSCDNFDPLKVKVENRFFSIPIDKKISLIFEDPKKTGRAYSFCKSNKNSPLEIIGFTISPGSKLFETNNFQEMVMGLQVTLRKSIHKEPRFRDQFSKIKFQFPNENFMNFTPRDGFHGLKAEKVIHFVSQENLWETPSGAPFSLTCNSELRRTLQGNELGYWCTTIYEWSDKTNLSFRFYSPKIPSEKWVILDAEIRSLIQGLEAGGGNESE